MKPILVLLLTVLSLSHGDPIGNPGNDAVDDPMDDPIDDTIDDRRGDPEDDFSDIEELEMLAFEQCESDGEEGRAAISAGVLKLQEQGTIKELKIKWWKKK